ncbi:hypothetical protein EJ03DRAFT_329112 [Teratosphaeria nubilosa]|uniref:Cyanovirin-N domain-containing protein n=1 Tax=Teratosphaeria nubilosa TaxID=161662 RepID=A0A6G1L4Y2_9PEZI|nr:hypothetical protein EJ03DRAFT_329112 [Teratosphaeria nubilosa]
MQLSTLIPLAAFLALARAGTTDLYAECQCTDGLLPPTSRPWTTYNVCKIQFDQGRPVKWVHGDPPDGGWCVKVGPKNVVVGSWFINGCEMIGGPSDHGWHCH